MTRAASSIMLLSCFPFLAACGTIVDFSTPTTENPWDRANLDEVIDGANELAEKYTKHASWVVNSAQAFEVPIIGAAIAGVTALGFGEHPDFALGAGTVGASAWALRSYYAPRERAQIYLDGAAAMSCVGAVGSKLNGNLKGYAPLIMLNTEVQQLNAANFAMNQNTSYISSILSSVDLTPTDVALRISSAIDEIKSNILKRTLEASSVPDMTEIAEKMAQAQEAGQTKRDALHLVYAQLNVTPTVDLSVIRDATDFEKDINTCVTKSGS